MNIQKAGIILAHAFAGWALCATTIGIGMALTSQDNALIIHALGAPIFFAFVSFFYFRAYAYTKPLLTALLFIAFVISMDFFLVGLVINRSLAMFTSLLGTWVPFILIFLSTYLTGLVAQKRNNS
jgi:hypothetical protein